MLPIRLRTTTGSTHLATSASYTELTAVLLLLFCHIQSAHTTVDLATLAAAGPDGLPDAAAADAAAAAEAKAAEDAAPKPEDVMGAFASAKVRCGAVLSFVWFNYLFVRGL
jgi:hypothetical protein